ncbi:molybdopterin-dependent oxidoreductase [Deinococcus sp. KNUC1210]|uniref:molybdopterin-dependent oxidoreductase n=1 Tax=Deinococcus sp. KNUC1210 TaxID=2917691 RepID=UPI001EEFBE5B|nr:molybdopterin-dependent oxidoreductase [Deinococcus sp. KNUC1210]ULH15071.1 molybdopterin-dependent oxidoreductase [Deinococcus sp. KNUC1210]
MRFLRAWITAVLLSVVGYLLFLWLGLAYPPLRLFGAMTQLLGVPKIFQLVHAVFGLGQGGKIFAFTGVAVLWLGGLTLLGGLWRGRIAGLIVFVLGLAFTPWYTALGYGVAFWLLLDAVNVWLAPRVRAVTVRPVPPDSGRRTTTLALATGGAVVAGGGLTALFRDPGAGAPATAASIVPGEPLPFGVTPVEQWYYVSKNLEPFDPNVNGKTWNLKVGGLVRTPLTLSLADLKSFTPVSEELTLSCISNPLGGPLISNGIWEGFRLSELLKKAGVQGGAKYLLWEAADGYTESLPLGRALEDDILLVHTLNGQPLTPKHGYPLRVLIPGRYGMKQPRWITKITLSATDVPGYWVRRGWSKTALVELTSRIDQPAEISPIVKAGAPGFIRGIAFYGDQPITKVEVTTDGGKTWQAARLIAPRSKSVWTPWELPWTPAAGSYDVQVRAYSGDRVQKKVESDALPEGATGYHHFIVNVS